MSVREFPLPDVGEGLTEAEIVGWRISVGDEIAVNQPIVDIETAKAVVELPSPFTGRVTALLVAPGAVVPVGTPILAVEVSDREPVLVGYGVGHEQGRRRRLRGANAPQQGGAGRVESAAPQQEVTRLVPPGKPMAKPPVRALARELGVDLSRVTPTGSHGDITRDDVRRAASGNASSPAPIAARPVRGERVPVRSVQRQMAQAMVRSMTTAPHVTEWVDVDVSATMALVKRLRAEPEFADARVTPLTIAASAVIHAIRRTPIVNSSWVDLPDGSAEIELYPFVNLGLAVASPRGLVVPNVRDAGSLSLSGLARAITEVTERAREGRLTPSDSVEGTITVTNIGVFGVDGGTPILNPGEAAILATGRIVERPWAVDGALAVRPVMQLSLAFDHRVVDGASGSAFLADVAAYLHRPPH
ncbi:MAG: 2-oxo acid dehydrogenase subunit E2 [Actinobacteria bacterium]|nr:2-oxo acid dehydrogenase subunit E2 [Actinomycetota bacterium]